MVFHLITLFPESFKSYFNASIIGRAIHDKKISVRYYNPRDYTKNKWRRIDSRPYGGGPGMVLEGPSVIRAVEAAIKAAKSKYKIVWLSPKGRQFDTVYAKRVSKVYKNIIIICGRYEGVDERVRKIFKAERVTVGPFVVTGGELPAMIVIDCVSRQIKGVLGNYCSREEERINSMHVYTRPEVIVWKGKRYRVPKILLEGNHSKIDQWRGRHS